MSRRTGWPRSFRSSLRIFVALVALLASAWVIYAQGPGAATNVTVNARGPVPAIVLLNPSSGAVGASVTITGTGFGAVQGTGTVTFNGVVATIVSWSSLSITATVPTTTTGNVVVTQASVASAGSTFTVSSGGTFYTGAVHNVTCSGTITTALQAAVDATANLDVVNISSGSCSAGHVSFSNKKIKIMGQGIGATTVAGLNFGIDINTEANFRITGMSVGSVPWDIYCNPSEVGCKGSRIDHIAWSSAGCTENIAVTLHANAWVLFDHNTFTNMGNALFQSNYVEGSIEVQPGPPDGTPGLGGLSWALALTPGTDNALYVEDNIFTLDDACFYGIKDGFYGARGVWRKNTISNAYWQNHAARTYERGGNAWVEIYENSFNAPDPNWSCCRAIHMRSGTGIVFWNRVTGGFVKALDVDDQRGDGSASSSAPYLLCPTAPYDGAGTGGYPCLDQIGRGPSVADAFGSQLSVPVHSAANGTSAGCNTYGSCTGVISTVNGASDTTHIQENRDFYNDSVGTSLPGTCTVGQGFLKSDEGDWDSTHSGADGRWYTCTSTNTWTLYYTPYTYPHPNQSARN